MPIVRIRKPWRHRSRHNCVLHCLCPWTSILIGEQRHRRNLTRPMTSLAIFLKDWQYVLIKGHRWLRRLRNRFRQARHEVHSCGQCRRYQRFTNHSSPLEADQKTYFSANCMILGPPLLLVIFPNCPPLKVTLGLPRRRLLVTLNASARNSICWPSVTWNFLETV